MFRSKSLRLGLTGISLALLAAGCNLIAGLDSPTYDPSLDNPGNTAADGSTNTEDGSVVGTDGSTTEDGGVDLDSGPPPFIDLTKLSLERISGQPGGPGFRDGTLAEARFANPQAIATDDGIAYVLDSGNHAVRKIVLADGTVSTFARDGKYLSYDELRAITVVTVGKREKMVVVASRNALITLDEKGNQAILAGEPNTAGYVNSKPGQGASARFDTPVALTTNGENIWVADKGTCTIRLIAPTGETSTVLGDGKCGSGALTSLTGIAYGADGTLYAASSGTVYTIDAPILLGPPVANAFASGVGDVSLLAAKALFGVDPKTHVVRSIAKGGSTVIAGTSNTTGFSNGAPPTQGTFNNPSGIAFGTGSQILVVDSSNNAIRVIDNSIPKLDTLAGSGPSQPGATDGNLSQSKLTSPEGVAFESLPDAGGRVATFDSTNKLRLVDLTSNTTSTLAVTSPITAGRGVVRDSANAKTYVADSNGAAIYVFADGQPLQLLAGTPGSPGAHGGIGVPQAFLSAHFNQPNGLALDAINGILYVADSGNQVIRKLDLKTSQLNTIGGPFTRPLGITLDNAGNLYISDRDLNRIWKVAGGVTTCVAGDCDAGTSGRTDGSMLEGKPTSRFASPEGLVHDGARFLYIADTGNHTLRAIDTTDPDYRVITIIGRPGAAGFATGNQSAARLNAPAWLTLIQTGTDTTGIVGSDRAENVLFRVNGL